MKILSILNQKGGCGKTTTAVNLAHAMSKKGYKTLLLDFDPQAHTTFSLGINHPQGICELMEALCSNSSPSLDDYLTQRDENFFVIPSSLGLSTLEQRMATREDKLFFAYKILSQNNSRFDYCIIDCPPNLGMLALNAILASTHLIVPLLPCDLSLKGLELLNNLLDMTSDHHANSLSVSYLLTQYDRRFRYSIKFLEKIRSSLKDKLLKTIIRTNISLREAPSEGKSIFEYKPKARGAYDYKQLTNELISITRGTEWARFFLKGDKFKEVYVIGDFNNWTKKEPHKMKKVGNQTWSVTIPLKKGKYNYKFLANEQWLNDPNNSLQKDDAYGGKNSILQVK